jgi:hypothetical protein
MLLCSEKIPKSGFHILFLIHHKFNGFCGPLCLSLLLDIQLQVTHAPPSAAEALRPEIVHSANFVLAYAQKSSYV